MRGPSIARFGGSIAVLATACSDGVTADPGLGLNLRIADAQLAPGPLPGDAGGPAVAFLQIPQSRVRKGVAGAGIDGRLAKGGVAVHIQLAGDPDHWVRPASVFDQTFPDQLLWSAKLHFARTTPAGDALVNVVAVDEEGRAGPIATGRFNLGEGAPPGVQSVTLEWDRPADVDLHVVLPDGLAVSAKNINSYVPPKPGAPPDPPDAWMAGVRLELDSNAGCVIDGLERETVFWPAAPPPGTYKVFVDLFAPCGVEATSFRVMVERDNGEIDESGSPVKQRVTTVDGTLYDFDARLHPAPPGGEAPGLFVTEFEAP